MVSEQHDNWQARFIQSGGFDSWEPEPQTRQCEFLPGFLKLPIPLFRDHGKNALAISALWNLREFRESGETRERHATITRLGVQPQTTFSRRLKALPKSIIESDRQRIIATDLLQLQRLFREGRFRERQTGSTQYLQLPK